MKRMLINATQEEELRMAMVDGQRLYDLNIEAPASERKKANIYKGKITRVEPSLEAAFVNYGAERHGFLPLKEISSEYFIKDPGSGKLNIKDVLREGQDIVVQIDKEERGNKGAALTTFVSLAGRFIVLKPNKSRSGGVSRRIVGDDRDAARKSLKNVDIPDGMSVILRTAGIDRTSEELSWDLENLMSVWTAILKVVVERPSPFLIYRESNAVVRALRDYLTNDIGEILIDDEPTYVEAREFVEQVMPHNLRKLKHYSDPVPLFTRYQIESQIESAFAHTVHLPSGGSLVIDHTEALVSIDINSARATKGGDIEATALNTNLESADEIARQLRLRDLGGLIVIDFIDMGPQKNQREVENRLREAVKQDRARIQIGKISRFGLLEMSRQRLRPSLGESSYLTCPRCSGIGNIRSVESLALAILRIIGEEARKERTAKVIAQLPVEVATYLLNEKRDWVQNLETRNDTQVVLVANELLETPHYRIRRVRDDQVELPENTGSSYTLVDPDEEDGIPASLQEQKPAEVAAVTTVVATSAAPARVEPVAPKAPGFLARLAAMFSGSTKEEKKKPTRKKAGSAKRTKKKQATKRAKTRGRGERNTESQDSSRSRSDRGKSKPRKRSRKPAKPKEEKVAQAGNGQGAPKKADQNAQGNNEETAKAPRKKRRSRGGRRRRKTGDRKDAQANNQSQEQNADGQQKDSPAADNGAGKAAPKESASKESPPKEAGKADNRGQVESAAPKPGADSTAAQQKAPAEPAKNQSRIDNDKRGAGDASTQNAGTASPSTTSAKASSESRGSDARPAASVAAAAVPAGTTAESNYHDTQPELPQLHTWKEGSESIAPAASKVVAVPPDKPDTPNPSGESPSNGPASGSPASEAKPAESSQAVKEAASPGSEKRQDGAPESKREDAKPEGRLLPWEPQAKPAGTASSDDEPTQR
ncbi:MAG: Rne/Rng family ribonuclease [Woeseia sp.]|nr:Rne/Rng family ribonuclease [Woeseia sp.]MBT8097085.1 Rne/Rng family ribonuclease [Woeseia sp.]NNE62059.1 Rne/Rng family ribonuclease [Woeseia sp.]NNL53670.1 Rne/Rng family ribonuclease [Woeseia sp.]